MRVPSPAGAVRAALITLTVAGFVVLPACGKKKSPTRVEEVDRLTEEGWKLFGQENYTDALAKFDAALDHLSEHADALHGRGWTLAFLGEFHEARTSLVSAKDYNSNDPDIWAGGAFVYSVLNDQDRVVYWAETSLGTYALNNDSGNWVFSRRTSITHIHLRLVLAKAYWVRGSYLQCSQQLDVVEPDVTHTEVPQELLVDLQRLSLLYTSPF